MAPRNQTMNLMMLIPLCGLSLLLSFGGCGNPAPDGKNEKNRNDSDSVAQVTKPVQLTEAEKKKKAEDYALLKEKIKNKQLAFRKSYAAADSMKKKKIISEARSWLLKTTAAEMLPAWYGTSWSFEGTCTAPCNGSIACGYFVTTVIQDLGFGIARVKWAQCASEELILHVSEKKDIKRYSRTPIEKVESGIRNWGKGLYLAGLDSHVGFILNYGDSIRFVHSNYYDPVNGVCAEEFSSNNPLRDSGYRVIGKLFSDEMVVCWIEGKEL